MRLGITLFLSVMLVGGALSQNPSLLRTTNSAGGVNQFFLPGSQIFLAQSIGQDGIIGTFSKKGITLIQGYIQPLNRTKEPGAKLSLQLEVFPNPVTQYLTIRFNEPIIAQPEVELLDMLGRRIYNTQTEVSNTITVNLETIDEGIYILVVTIGEKSAHRKIVKQKS